MALPQFKFTELDDNRTHASDASHYFDTAHGDVAALHGRIERGFAEHQFDRPPHSGMGDRFEDSIRLLSRSAGIVGFVGALCGIAYLAI